MLRRASTPASDIATGPIPRMPAPKFTARRHPGRQCRPARQPAQRVVRRGTQPAPVALMEHLGLVGRHVDTGRAVRQATLARQAQVERLVHLRGSPATGDGRAVDHLLQHPGTPAGGVLLLPGRQVRRAHHPAGRGVVGAALTDPGAAVHRLGEISAVAVVGQCQVPAPDRRRFAKVRVERPRVDDHSGVEDVLRVEHVLDRPEQLQCVCGVHRRQ